MWDARRYCFWKLCVSTVYSTFLLVRVENNFFVQKSEFMQSPNSSNKDRMACVLLWQRWKRALRIAQMGTCHVFTQGSCSIKDSLCPNLTVGLVPIRMFMDNCYSMASFFCGEGIGRVEVCCGTTWRMWADRTTLSTCSRSFVMAFGIAFVCVLVFSDYGEWATNTENRQKCNIMLLLKSKGVLSLINTVGFRHYVPHIIK